MEERCRELRCGTAGCVSETNRSLRIHRDPARGTMTITVELPLEAGELIDKALDKAREECASAGPEFSEESFSAQQADALVTMANAYLTGQNDTSTASAEHYQVTVHVDRSALSEGHGRSGLPIESVRRLCCDGETVVIVEDQDGGPLNVGRKSRTVPTAIKRALWARDKGCTFPGCSHKHFVDAHHIRHSSMGGETSLENLMLPCIVAERSPPAYLTENSGCLQVPITQARSDTRCQNWPDLNGAFARKTSRSNASICAVETAADEADTHSHYC